MGSLRTGNAARRGVPNTRDVVIEQRLAPATPQMLEPVGRLQEQMARDGVRYGDPDLPRYATARVDGRAPELSTRTDFTMRTKRGAGGEGDPKIGHPSKKGLVQPQRRS